MWSRTRLLIDAKMQFRVVVQMALVTLLAAIAILMTVYFHEKRVVSFIETSGAGSAVASQVSDLNQGLVERLLIIVILMIITFVVMGLALTHRIAGPIWRLRSELQKALAGESVKPLQFRADDEFQELPQMINQLIEKSKK